MSWPGTITLYLDDEAAGGDAAWQEITVPGAIPRVGDTLVTGGGNVAGPWVVDAVMWTFTQPGSMNATSRRWEPHVRVQVRRP